MHIFYKLMWAIRAILMKPFFGKFQFPGYIGSPVFVYGAKKIFISRKVRIFPGLRVECHGEGRLFIHENVTIGQNLHITCMGKLEIGKGTIMSGDVMITDIDHDYKDVTRSVIEQPNCYSKTHIGENCFIGFGSRIQAGTILGKGCVVGTNAVVRGNFPPHSVIVGVPAKIVKRYSSETNDWIKPT